MLLQKDFCHAAPSPGREIRPVWPFLIENKQEADTLLPLA
jgi:hypothetical protein